MPCEIVHSVKRNNTGIAFGDHLTVSGVSIDLTDASVRCIMRTKAGVVLFASNATVLQDGDDQDKEEPNVEYRPTTEELDTLGTHDLEWEVTLPSGRVITRPGAGYHKVRIYERLTD